MNIHVVGLNHKTAPIEVREQFFLTPIQQDQVLSELRNRPEVAEAFVLSTCNRTEVYINAITQLDALPTVRRIISGIKKIPGSTEVREHFYQYHDREALRHLLAVTAGLDSLVLGEKQILGQIKTAVERARQKTMFGRYFNILFNVAIKTGKKARTETDISYGGSSVSWAAVTMAEEQLGTLAGKSVLIIGAGKMGGLTLNQIRNKGVKEIYLMNRTGFAAETLAESCHGIPVSFSDIKETLAAVDVCVCSVGAPHYILDKPLLQKIMTLRNGRPLILIDISMPRNVDPDAGSVEGVHLFFIDDLQKVVNANLTKRQAAVTAVEALVERKLTYFYEKLDKALQARSAHPHPRT